ncbi:hypothetical protein P4O66_020951, partial [Electrophorus voltai]
MTTPPVALTSVVMKCFEKLTDHNQYGWATAPHPPSNPQHWSSSGLCPKPPALNHCTPTTAQPLPALKTIVKFADDT